MEDRNPLLDDHGHPHYSSIRAEHVEPAVRQRIGEWRLALEQRAADPAPPTWENLIAPLDEASERLERAYRPADHLVRVLNEPSMREADRRVKALIADFETECAQDDRLWRTVTTIRERADETGLTPERRKLLDDELREFRLAGVHLPSPERERLRQIRSEMARLAVEFAEHVTGSTDEFRLVVERPDQIVGLPDTLVAAARHQALSDDPSAPPHRWSFTLHAPSLTPFLAHQRDRGLREALQRAFVLRATAAPHDNSPLIHRTLELRAESARLLGFRNYAELALQRRMAKSPEEVHAFLVELAGRAMPHARREKDELERFAEGYDGTSGLQRCDRTFYAERLRQQRFAFSDEEVRAYFPVARVVQGFFAVVSRLYGVEMVDITGADGFETWHPDVRVYEARERDGSVLGHVFVDYYSRPGKHSGAWVSGGSSHWRRPDGRIERPSAHLTCNFPAPDGGRPSLLRHDEVRVFFHEFGHALHHVLSTTEDRQGSGTRGVPRDGVEFPSQFLENWIWHSEPLGLISGHVETGEPLPRELLAKMIAARNFMKATDILRQMEYALFDLEIHMEPDPSQGRGVRGVFESVRRIATVFPTPEYDRFENSFQHIFSGGYAAGYYGYAWAEVLAADAFERFREDGIWSQAAARDFRDKLLARGGSADFMQLFVDFRGRRPSPDALLRSSGLA